MVSGFVAGQDGIRVVDGKSVSAPKSADEARIVHLLFVAV